VGDFDADGRPDIFVGFSRKSGVPSKLYHNLGNGKFVDVAGDLGIKVEGEVRQISWIDFDNDGKLDLFVALRDAPNLLFHNQGNRFVEVGKDMGVADPRKTVCAVWFDFNQDGRLDCFTANQDGTLDGLFRNDGGKFVDVAAEMKMDQAGRPADHGRCGPTVIDYNNNGLLDLFVAGYGQNLLYRNEGNGTFRNAIRVCVIPLVCNSLIVGCAASRDTGRLGRLAGKSLVLMLSYLFLSAIFAGALAFPIFHHFSGLIKNIVRRYRTLRSLP
jgi:hypothetical protein